MKPDDEIYMQQALALAEKGATTGEVPVGCVIVHEGEVVAESFNQPIATHNPCAHAEILALEQAGQKLQNYRLKDATVYVTLEPCPMCVGAMIHARIKRCVFGAFDPKTGAMGSVVDIQAVHKWNHQIIVEGGVLAERCGQLLSGFFKTRRT